MKETLERLRPFWRPHPGQLEFLLAQSKVKVLACGRRWGKTDACAVLLADGLDEPGDSQRLILAPTAEQSRLLFERTVCLHEKLNGPLPKANLRGGPHPHFRVNGHKVMARSGHRGNSLRGLEASLIVVDEAAFVPESLVLEIASPMLATTNGLLVLISTPNGHNYFWRYFQMGQEGKHGIWSRTGPSSENPKVSQEFLDMQREFVSDLAFETEYLAQFQDVPGSLFREEAIRACLSPSVQFSPHFPVGIGVDWGQTNDYTALVAVQPQGGKLAVLESQRIRQAGFDEMMRFVAARIRAYPNVQVAVDATGIGQKHMHESFCKYVPDVSVKPVDFKKDNKASMVTKLAFHVDQGRLILPPNEVLLDELRQFGARKTVAGNVQYQARSGHDDLVIALALACSVADVSTGLGILVGDRR